MSTPASPSVTAPLRFWHRGALVQLGNVPPQRTLLEVLREDLRLVATKEGCAAGDCGACTVVVARPQAGQDRLQWQALNSCIRPAHAIDGLALWPAEDLADADGALHPAQQALQAHHGSQCGFCTPGVVMSLFGLYQRRTACGQPVQRHEALQALSGNLCRCTGYRPIVQAACAMRADARHAIDEAALARTLQALPARPERPSDYRLPRTLGALLQARAADPQAQLIAGATDVGLWITQGLQPVTRILDLSRVQELQQIQTYPHHIAIGAAVSLQEAFDALAAERPAIGPFAERFAGWPIRQSGTLGGNVANGSPIGDSMPLLVALGAQAVLMAWRGRRIVHRHVPIESLYTGYRRHVLAADEVLAWVVVPRPQPQEWLGVYKVSKRHEDDISAVCLALQLQLVPQASGAPHIRSVRLGLGGVAPTPVRAVQTEAQMQGRPWSRDTLAQASQTLCQEFQPISDLRASAHYRRQLMAALLERAWLESQQTGEPVRLEALA